MSQRNTSQGHYWYAPMPDGKSFRWAVFWHHPDDGNIHHQVAIFFDADRAARYVQFENGNLNPAEPPVATTEELIAGVSLRADVKPYEPPRGMRAHEYDALCLKIKDDLPSLFQKYRHGITTRHIREEYDAPYDRCCQVLRWLENQGLGQYVFANGSCGAKILLSPDVVTEKRELTENQVRVIGALKQHADRHGLVCLSITVIADSSSVPAGSIPSILIALEKKDYLMLAKPGGGTGGGPATYQLTEKALALELRETA